MSERRDDIYTRITAEIVTAIQNGAREWRMPWNHDGGSITRPRNVASDKSCRGINVLALWIAARRSGYASGIGPPPRCDRRRRIRRRLISRRPTRVPPAAAR